MFLKFFFTSWFLFFVISCSNNTKNQDMDLTKNNKESPEYKYIEAMNKFDNQEFEEAKTTFKYIQKIYPLSNEAIQSQIMMGFIDYIKLDYDSAIIKFSTLISKYPSLKNIDYVYYMKALCFYEQISNEGLDGKYNLLALENLNQVINRFPNSKYAKDSYQKIKLVNSNIAAKNMNIARFYHKNNKHTAALSRYKIVVDEFSETKFTPEALYRIAEIYFSIGMIDESTKTAAILGHNYPKSDWYKLIYKNLKTKDKNSLFSNTFGNFFN